MCRGSSATVNLLSCVVVVITCIAGTNGTPPHHCPHNGTSYDGRCYWVSERKSSWTDANILCHRLYGDNVTLATIRDVGTNRFIRGLTNSTVWIGLHEASREDDWRWVDNTLLDGYSNWAESAPSGAGTEKYCAVMFKKGDQWRDVACRGYHKFVCKHSSSSHVCSRGGIFFRDRCYWPVEEPMPFSNANGYCQEHFGNDTRIAVAKDHRTNLFLSRLIYPRIWLGLTDKGKEGRWRWVDNSPLRYSNWRAGEPNNMDHEDCAVLIYENAKWNDEKCGRWGEDEGDFHPDVVELSSYDASELLHLQPIKNVERFVCAVPSCYDTAGGEDGSGSGELDADIIDTNTVCLREECSSTCVDGSVCGATGECVCTEEFPGMVCDENDFQMKIIPPVVKTTLGGSFTLKCQFNLPARYIFGQTVLWSPVVEGRATIKHHLHRGYSLLEVTDVQPTDNATEYACSVILMRSEVVQDVSTLFRRSTSVVNLVEPGQITVSSPSSDTTNKPATNMGETVSSTSENDGRGNGPSNETQDIPNRPDGRSKVAIVLLSISVSILMVAVIVLVIRMRRLERSNPGVNRLIELNEKS